MNTNSVEEEFELMRTLERTLLAENAILSKKLHKALDVLRLIANCPAGIRVAMPIRIDRPVEHFMPIRLTPTPTSASIALESEVL